jgi:protein TonB
MLEYIYNNLKYPDEAKIAGIEGRVVVQFIVERNGELTDVKAARDIGYGCGEEAMRIVNSMNTMDKKWTPGKQRGKPVRVQFTLPIQFKL